MGLAALLALLGAGAGAVAAEPAPPVGEPRSGALAPGMARPFVLTLRKGDFVRGHVQADAGTLDLDLLDGDLPNGDLHGGGGRAVRRLNGGVTGNGAFLFTAEQDGPVTLRVGAAEGAEGESRFTLRIDQLVPLDRQTPPVEVPLSSSIAKLAADVAAGGGTAAFWAQREKDGTPLIERLPQASGPDRFVMTFLWRGAERNVRLFGGPSAEHEELQRLGATDVWYKSYEVPASTRVSYQLAPDVPTVPGGALDRRRAILATAQADPLNRHPWPADARDRFERKSLAALPDAPPQDVLTPRAVPKGRIEHVRFASTALGNERTVTLYTPPGHDTGSPAQALLVLFDGAAYQTKVPTPTILDNLIADRRIPPTLAVLIDNPDIETRGRELPPNPVFADALAGDLMAMVRARSGTAIPAERTVVAGSSYGGLAAAYAAFRHPEVFGNVLSQSGSFWWHPADAAPSQPEHMAELFLNRPPLPIRFYLEAGLFETGRPQHGILETTRHLRDVLRAKGYAVTHREHASGHDYASWRVTLADGLVALLGRERQTP